MARPTIDTPGDREPVTRVVHDGYEAIADRYLAGIRSPGTHEPLVQTINWTRRLITRLAAGSNVLDIGCGPGVPVAVMLADAGHCVTGVDLSPRQVELARDAVPAGTFVVSDIRDLEWAARSLDAAVMLYTISHLPRHEHAQVLETVASWLRPGAWMLINLDCSDVEARMETDFLGYGVENWTSAWDLHTNEQVLADAGFEIEQRDVIDEPAIYSGDRWLWSLARRHG